MTDEEYRELCDIIERKMFELDHLQEIHRRETGRGFVRGIKLYDEPHIEREVQIRPIWARAGGE